MATADLPDRKADRGALANNYMFVRALQSALSTSETNISAVRGALDTVIEDECWRHWLTMEGREFTWNAADFREFIEAPRPAGCQSKIHFVRTLVRDTDMAERFEELIRAERGGSNNPDGLGGWSGKTNNLVNRDNVTVDKIDSTIIPLSQGLPRVRDFSREAPTGNSTSYALRQLERGKQVRGGERIPARPDLLEKVKTGVLTPHAAAIQAGFRKPTVAIPLDPEAATRLIVKHFKGEALEALIRGLANWAGVPLAEETEVDAR